jgi:4-carboxymuconolactone decarboxylase
VSPRLKPVTDPGPEVAELLATMPAQDGAPLNVFATLARHPRLLKRMNVFGGLFLAHGSLPAREQEIVILRMAWRTGCVYEFGRHTLLARQAGLSDAEIAALAGAESAWTPADQLLVDIVDQVDSEARLDGVTWDQLHAAYGEMTAIEVLFLAGFYRMLAGFLNTVEVELEPGVRGWPAIP